MKELTWKELNHSFKPSDFSFKSTAEIGKASPVFGQEAAIKSIERALKINSKGYNLYVCNSGDKIIDNLIIDEIKKLPNQTKRLLATGYVYNFHKPEQPLSIEMDVEDAEALKQSLEQLVMFIQNDIAILLESEDLRKKQESIINEFKEIKDKLLEQVDDFASDKNIMAKLTADGFQFIPLSDRKEGLTKTEFSKLSTKKQNKIMENLVEVENYSNEIMEKLTTIKKDYVEMLNEIEQEEVLKKLGLIIKKMIEENEAYPKVVEYINNIAENLLEHMEEFIDYNIPIDASEDEKAEMHNALMKQKLTNITDKYHFNILSAPTEMPIINDLDYPEMSLTGKLLMDPQGGSLSSDYSCIIPGLIHKANGGYLILHLEELAEKGNSWQAIKNILKYNRIRIEGSEEMGISLSKPVKPEAMDINTKVILIGDKKLYNLLNEADPDFKKLFKLRIDFRPEVDCDKARIENFAGIIKTISDKEGILPVTIEGVLKLVELGNKQVEDSSKLPSDVDELIDVLREAQIYAEDVITLDNINQTLRDREEYLNYLKETIDESYDGTYLLDTKGEKVGQINGLAVYELAAGHIGRPVRITVTTFKGTQGIVDLEDTAKLSGSIHTKGVGIVSGFLGNQFAQEYPLALNCNICFEQSYSQIDGDSASSTELYAILSSLAQAPIKQSLAVTGSVNQFGEIQPIGGVNAKIEGFFSICKKHGLVGDEGVLIPIQNVKDLILNDEVTEAVKNGQFHIYPVENIWEGAEILMGVPKEELIQRVDEKLRKFSK